MTHEPDLPFLDQPYMGPLPAAPGCDCHVCRPEGGYDEIDENVIATVLEHGWQVLVIGAGCQHPDHDDELHPHDEDGPVFAYTVGLGHRAGHPELLMAGLDPGVMHRALNGLAQRVMAGRRLAPGDAVEDVLAGVPVAVEAVSEEGRQEAVPCSGWFHRREPEAVAIVWPDRSGVFAWQPGAPEVLDERQPRAWREPITHTGGLAADPSWDFPVPPDRFAFSCTHVVDRGDAVLWAARELAEDRGEDWSIHCGAEGHATDDMRLVHIAHLVRAAPSLRLISDLGMEHEAWRDDADSEWEIARIAR